MSSTPSAPSVAAAPPGSTGAAVSQWAPPAQPGTPGVPTPGRQRRAWVLAASIVAVVVLAGAVFASRTLLADDKSGRATDTTSNRADDSSDQATDEVPTTQDSSDVVVDETEATTSAEPTESPSPTATPSATSTPPAAHCWDGASAATVDQCSMPSGKQGIRWVFPSLDLSSCRKSVTVDRYQLWNCQGHLADGTWIRINYTEWKSSDKGFANYSKTGVPGAWPGGRTRWVIYTRAGESKAAVMYNGQPWSVTVYGPTDQARDQALDQLVKMRPVAQLRGTQ